MAGDCRQIGAPVGPGAATGLLGNDRVVGKADLAQVDHIAHALGQVGRMLAAGLSHIDAGGIACDIGRHPKVVALLVQTQLAIVAQVVGAHHVALAIGYQVQLIALARYDRR